MKECSTAYPFRLKMPEIKQKEKKWIHGRPSILIIWDEFHNPRRRPALQKYCAIDNFNVTTNKQGISESTIRKNKASTFTLEPLSPFNEKVTLQYFGSLLAKHIKRCMTAERGGGGKWRTRHLWIQINVSQKKREKRLERHPTLMSILLELPSSEDSNFFNQCT